MFQLSAGAKAKRQYLWPKPSHVSAYVSNDVVRVANAIAWKRDQRGHTRSCHQGESRASGRTSISAGPAAATRTRAALLMSECDFKDRPFGFKCGMLMACAAATQPHAGQSAMASNCVELQPHPSKTQCLRHKIAHR